MERESQSTGPLAFPRELCCWARRLGHSVLLALGDRVVVEGEKGRGDRSFPGLAPFSFGHRDVTQRYEGHLLCKLSVPSLVCLYFAFTGFPGGHSGCKAGTIFCAPYHLRKLLNKYLADSQLIAGTT